MISKLVAVGFIAVAAIQSADRAGEPSVRGGLTAQVIETPLKGRALKGEMTAKQVADLIAGLEKNFAAEAQRDGKVVHTEVSYITISPPDLGGTAGKALKLDTYVGSTIRISLLMGVTKNQFVRVACVSDGVENARFFGTICGEQATKAFDGKLPFGARD